MKKRRSKGTLRLKTDEEVISYVNSFANGDRVVNGIGIEMAIIDELTPALARFFLDNGVTNRNPNVKHVGVLTESIKSGGFIGGIDPIRINAKGQAFDFRNRCLAIVTSGISVKGVPLSVLADDRAMTVLDTDSWKRTLKNLHDIRGEKSPPLSVVSGIIFEMADFRNRKVGTQARDRFVKAYDQRAIMDHLYAINGKVTGGLLAAAARCARVDEEKAKQFFSLAIMKLEDYSDIHSSEKPVELKPLRAKLAEQIRDRVRGNQRLRIDAAAGVYCFERYMAGANLKNFCCPRAELTKDDDKKNRKLGQYIVIDYGRAQFKASPVSNMMDDYFQIQSDAEKVVREYLKSSKDTLPLHK